MSHSTVRYRTVQHGTVRYGRTGMAPYGTLRHGTGTVRYDTVRYRYGTVPYGTVRYSDVWITNGTVFTKFIRYFELSKNCRKIRVPGVMTRTGELGNTG